MVTMRKLDLIVGIVGGIVLVAALAGAYREGSTGTLPPGSFAIQWETKTVDLPAADGPEVEFNLTTANLTLLTFTVTTTAGNTFVSPNGDAVEVTVTPPEGSGLNVSTGSGTITSLDGTETITVEVRVNAIPPVGVATGASNAQALRDLAATQTSTLGMGVWSVQVNAGRGVTGQGQVTFSTTVSAEAYQATLKDPTAPAPAQP